MGFTLDREQSTGEKVLVTLLIDVSESMGWKIPGKNLSRIDELKSVLESFISQKGSAHYVEGSSIQDISNLLITGELAVGLFSTYYNNSVKWLNLGENKTSFPFHFLDQSKSIDLSRELKAEGATPLAEAVEQAVEVTLNRYNELINQNYNVKRPNIFIITDGKQDPRNPSLVTKVSSLIRHYEEKLQLMVFGISVFDGDTSDLEKIVLPNAVHILSSQKKMSDLVKIISVSVVESASAGSNRTVVDLHDDINSAVETNLNFFNNLNIIVKD